MFGVISLKLYRLKSFLNLLIKICRSKALNENNVFPLSEILEILMYRRYLRKIAINMPYFVVFCNKSRVCKNVFIVF